MNMPITPDKDYGIKCIPHPQPEFKYIFPYRTERELYTYKSKNVSSAPSGKPRTGRIPL